MDSPPEAGTLSRTRPHRRRRAWWRRRRFWILVFAVLGSIAITLWLIQGIGARSPD